MRTTSKAARSPRLLAIMRRRWVVHLYSENGWESISGDELSDKLDEVDEEYIIDAGSGERLELKDPEW